MLTNEQKRQIREYFGIKNITVNKKRDGFDDVNEYYEHLCEEMTKKEILKKFIELRKQEEIESQEKAEKRKLKNKLKKLRKRMNRKLKENSDSSESDTDDEIEQIKPYVYFTPSMQYMFHENLYLIEMLNRYYDSNENYRKYLLEHHYEKIKITRPLHVGFTDEYHFNGYFYSANDENVSSCIHFYVNNDEITKLTHIISIL